jgi:hypothetical protein
VLSNYRQGALEYLGMMKNCLGKLESLVEKNKNLFCDIDGNIRIQFIDNIEFLQVELIRIVVNGGKIDKAILLELESICYKLIKLSNFTEHEFFAIAYTKTQLLLTYVRANIDVY